MSTSKVILLPKTSYLQLIENSYRTRLFQNFFACVDGEETEILDGGDKSCALYLSGILCMFGLLPRVDVTVRRTLSLMEENGWFETHELKEGCVIVYKEKMYGESNPRMHMGFYMGGTKAMSNNGDHRTPNPHLYSEYNGRGIDTLWWHTALESDDSLRKHMNL